MQKEIYQESRFDLVLVYFRRPPIRLARGGPPFTNHDPTLQCFALTRLQRRWYLCSFWSIATHCNFQCLAPWRVPKEELKVVPKGPKFCTLPDPCFCCRFLQPFLATLCVEKSLSPTQLKDFDALLLMPSFESLTIQKRLKMQARAPSFRSRTHHCQTSLHAITRSNSTPITKK